MHLTTRTSASRATSCSTTWRPIRVNPARDETLVGRPFLRDRLVVVAAPDMARPRTRPVPAVLRGGHPARSWNIGTAHGAREIAIDPVLRLSSLVMIPDAVRYGAGAARLPLSLVSRDIAGGRLGHWGDVAGSDIALRALYPTRRLLNARVSAFLELLRHSFPQGAPEESAAYLEE